MVVSVILQGSTEVSYLMVVSNHLRMGDVHTCGEELNVYLQDFDNWGRPVIPPVEGCPEPVFDPDYFFDGSTGRDWLCLQSARNGKTGECQAH